MWIKTNNKIPIKLMKFEEKGGVDKFHSWSALSSVLISYNIMCSTFERKEKLFLKIRKKNPNIQTCYCHQIWSNQGHSQPHSPRWARVPLSSFFLKFLSIIVIFLIFSNFHPHFGPLDEPLAHPGRPWLCHWVKYTTEVLKNQPRA